MVERRGSDLVPRPGSLGSPGAREDLAGKASEFLLGVLERMQVSTDIDSKGDADETVSRSIPRTPSWDRAPPWQRSCASKRAANRAKDRESFPNGFENTIHKIIDVEITTGNDRNSKYVQGNRRHGQDCWAY